MRAGIDNKRATHIGDTTCTYYGRTGAQVYGRTGAQVYGRTGARRRTYWAYVLGAGMHVCEYAYKARVYNNSGMYEAEGQFKY